MPKISHAPRQLSPQIVHFSREESARLVRYIERAGSILIAAKLLRVGEITLDAARDQGRMQRRTRDRLLEALDREEASLSVGDPQKEGSNV